MLRAMPSYRKRGSGWRAELYRDGQRESATFPTKTEAVAWATQREAELTGARLPDKTLQDALSEYERRVAPTHRGERWEVARLGLLSRDAIAGIKLAKLTAAHLADWRDRRLAEVAPASVRREMTLLKSVLDVARREWGWLRSDPLDGVRRPTPPASRKRRISPAEVEKLTFAFGLAEGYAADTAMQRTGLAFLFALETAMRAGEILGLTWPDVSAKSVRLPLTKNGDARSVPLSPAARSMLAVLDRSTDRVFDLEPGTRDALFRKARTVCQIPDLHFHDSRAEAIWRLSKHFDVMELARVIGHRDLRSLLLYYNASADELADRLG
jgi:integrase